MLSSTRFWQWAMEQLAGRHSTRQFIARARRKWGTFPLEPLEPRQLLSAALMQDVNQLGVSSQPQCLTDVNGTLFFVAYDRIHGWELWKSSGAEGSTQLVKDIAQNDVESTQPDLGGLVNLNGVLLFWGRGGTANGLWTSDGTEAGTFRISPDMPLGWDSLRWDPISGNAFTRIGDELFYFGRDAAYHTNLYRTDGTEAGTVRVKGSVSVSLSENCHPVAANNTLFFVANSDLGAELWKSDGTEAGTGIVKDIRPGSNGSSPSSMTSVNGTVFFTTIGGKTPYELWKTDGTEAGTMLVKGFSTASGPSLLTSDGNKLLFTLYNSAYGSDLWTSDGTAAGTVSLMRLAGTTPSAYANAKDMIRVGDTVYLVDLYSRSGTSSSFRLWTVAGGSPNLIKTFPGTDFGSVLLNSCNGEVYFSMSDPAYGVETWRSNGTPSGTTMVADVCKGNASSVTGATSYVAGADGAVFFAATDGSHGWELWKTDGEESGTTLVKDISSGTDSSSPRYVGQLGNSLFFTAYDGVQNTLWKTDGTTGSTELLSSIEVDSNIVQVGQTLYFGGRQGLSGSYALWKTNGTAQGTAIVKDFYGTWRGSGPRYLTNINGSLIFIADEIGNNVQLWKSDGTAVGTRVIKRIRTDGGSPFQGEGPLDLHEPLNPSFAVLNGRLFFLADDGVHGQELWKTDGTEGGTALVKDVVANAGLAKSRSRLDNCNVVELDGSLYFIAGDAVKNFELWRSDGTEDGTALVKRISLGASRSSSLELFKAGNRLSFVANSQWWTSDGNEAGTVPIQGSGVSPFCSYTAVTSPAMVNGTLYFAAMGAGRGLQLWKTDGTRDGTAVVKDPRAGTADSTLHDLINVGDLLYFIADDGAHGRELWVSDGTEPGTHLVIDSLPGNASSFLAYEYRSTSPKPAELFTIGDALYFSAADAVSGTELWRLLPTTLQGTPQNDVFALQPDASGAYLQLYVNSPTSGKPTFTIGGGDLDTLRIDAGEGDDVLTIDLPPGRAPVPLALTFTQGSDHIDLKSDLSLAGLDIAPGAQVTLGGTGLNRLFTQSLSLGAGATLDLGNNTLIIQASDATRQGILQQVSNWVSGVTPGQGKGIISSFAAANPLLGLAVVLNDMGGGTRLDPTLDANAIFVKATWNGDVNLDGKLDAADYFLIDSGFITQQGGYQHGDLNSDGVVDASDYFLIDSAFIAQTGVLATQEISMAPSADEVLVLKATPVAKLQQATSILEQLFSSKPAGAR